MVHASRLSRQANLVWKNHESQSSPSVLRASTGVGICTAAIATRIGPAAATHAVQFNSEILARSFFEWIQVTTDGWHRQRLQRHGPDLRVEEVSGRHRSDRRIDAPDPGFGPF